MAALRRVPPDLSPAPKASSPKVIVNPLSRWLLALLLLLWLPLGCVDIFGLPRCQVDQDCPGSAQCDQQAGLCQQRPTRCTADTDCLDGKICDPSAGICFDPCTSDNDCSEGDICDPARRRCTCTRDECRRRDGGRIFGCHPLLTVCIPHCQNDGDCESPERCLGPTNARFCITPAHVVHECGEDSDCQAPTSQCDTSAIPRTCIHPPKTSCSSDSDCVNNKEARRCQIATSRCVFCLFDEDCFADGQRCLPDGTCR